MISSSSSRRQFLSIMASAVGAGLLARMPASVVRDRTDEEIFQDVIAFAQGEALAERPLGKILSAVGRFFLDTPYVAHTLEEPGEEHLVVNFRGFDCETFVENTLALSRCIRSQHVGIDDFRAQLTLIRYRSGILKGYPSRLHYFTDWIADNMSKGVVRDITLEVGGKEYTKTINYMTTHRSMYPQLSTETTVEEIAAVENRLSAGYLHRVVREDVRGALPALQDGDIIGLTTSMERMDVSHTGMVIVESGIRRFLHAPLSGKHVMIAQGSLADYVDSIQRHTGIVVARPQEVGR